MSGFVEVQQCVRSVIQQLMADESTLGISPSLVARSAYTALLRNVSDVPLPIEWAAIEQLKQTARAELRGKLGHESDANETYQGDMFSGHLQKFYPVRTAVDADPIYKLRDLMTHEEAAQNVRALRKQANARVAHADALEAWDLSRSLTPVADVTI